MTVQPKLIFMAGSARRDSFNKKLAKAARSMAAELGAEATFIDLKDYEIPLYDGDLEAGSGIPENARRLRNLFAGADGFFIASPEYNASISALLKNTLDWISRPDGDVPGQVAFRGKVAAISAASPGALGGLRGLVPLRGTLVNNGALVLSTQHALGGAGDAFDEQGNITVERHEKAVHGVVAELVRVSRALKGG